MNIVAAFLNSLWQAAAVAVLVRIAIRRLNAATRHVIWWIALAAMIALPFVPRISFRQDTLPLAAPPPAVRSVPIRVAPPFVPPAPDAPVTITDHRRPIWPAALFALWLGVGAHLIFRLTRDYFLLRAIQRRATDWNHSLPVVGREVRLLLSSEISSPIAIGFLRPAIILPDTLPSRLTARELHDVLLHECAHVARYDDWTNLMVRVLGAAFALHPVVWSVLRRIERERELACDDWVVAHTGAPHAYAESLTRIVELRFQPTSAALATGIFTRRSSLRARIEILLQRGRGFSTAAARIPLATAAIALVVLTAAGALAPRWIAFAQRLEFEIASVKRNTNDGPIDTVPRRSGDLVIMHNVQPYTAIFYAWHLRGNYQIAGYQRLPDHWNWYDIDARVGRSASDQEIRLMMQSLLEDRFKLKVHRETRDIPEYELIMPKGKNRLKPSDSQEPMNVTIAERTFPTDAGQCGTSVWRDGQHMICHSAPMEKVVVELATLMRAPVVDRTGISGTYDLHICFRRETSKLAPEEEFENDGLPLEQAIQEELGLKLEKGKGPVEVLVIDHMERPSGN